MRACFKDLQAGLDELKQLTVSLAELKCPGTFLFGPDLTPIEAMELEPRTLLDEAIDVMIMHGANFSGFFSDLGNVFGHVANSVSSLVQVRLGPS